jgi:hypothetical protein
LGVDLWVAAWVGSKTPGKLRFSAETRGDLRFVHLATHLETPAVLSLDQIKIYNRLRGY